jgi:hypothetical protein
LSSDGDRPGHLKISLCKISKYRCNEELTSAVQGEVRHLRCHNNPFHVLSPDETCINNGSRIRTIEV